MLSDSDIKKLVEWLLSARGMLVSMITPGILAWLVDVVQEEESDLALAKEHAGRLLADIVKREHRVPPEEIIKYDYGLDSPRYQEIPPERKHGGKALAAHLVAAWQLIQSQACLVRRLNEAEARVYIDPEKARSVADVFPSGTHGDKAFAIQGLYQFTDSSRNKQEGKYDYIIEIKLTTTLRDYLLKYLWLNMHNSSKFKANPQAKYENGVYNMIILKEGWINFWERVEVFQIKTKEGEIPESLVNEAKDWWHQRQLSAFNMDKPTSLPKGAMPYIN